MRNSCARGSRTWQNILSEQIERISAAAVFVGVHGFGSIQRLEHEALIQQFVDRDCLVIPVILPSCVDEPKLPVFLRTPTWVDFRRAEPNPIAQLFWGITGQRPEDGDEGVSTILERLTTKRLLDEIRSLAAG